MTAADVNGDGKPDLVIADYSGSTVSVLLGNGSGGFGSAINYPAGLHPVSATTADVNRDGKLDLVVADYPGSVSVLLGTGSGGFAAATSYPTSFNLAAMTTADLNGDGKLDVIVADYTDSVEVLLGNGSGGFGAPTTYAAGVSPRGLTTADVNGDGKLDLVVANSSNVGVMAVLLGDGSGGFGTAATYAAGPTPKPITAVDLNGDGKPDLVTADVFGGVSVLLDGSGAPSTFTLASAATASGHDTGLVVATTPTVVAVTTSPGAGTFGAGAVITLNVLMSGIVSVSGGVPMLTLNDGGTAGYVSGSGTRTLVFASTVGVGQSTGDLAVTGAVLNGAVIRSLAGVAADLTGAVATPAGTLAVNAVAVAATVTGIAAAASTSGVLGVGKSVRFTVALLQTVAVTGAPTLSLNNNGTATYTAAGSTGTSLLFDYTVLPGQDTAGLAVTGLVLNGGAVAVPAGLGFGASSTYGAGTNPYAAAAADLNNDGKLDWVFADFAKTGVVSVALGDGSGGFGASSTYAAGLSPSSVAIADVNGDGILDLAVANYDNGYVSVLLGNGSGGFGPLTSYAAGPNPYSVTAADLNGDGIVDLVVTDLTGGVAVLLGNGSGGFGALTTYAAGTAPKSVTAADVNGDGKPDLVVEIPATLSQFCSTIPSCRALSPWQRLVTQPALTPGSWLIR